MKAWMLFFTLFVMLPAELPAQATYCNDPNASPQVNSATQQQWGSRRSPVYQDVTDLAETLNEHGFHVQCIRGSVGERFFAGQKGAIWFKTDQGVFDVWFLPKPETFANLEIDEKRENGRYVYSFRGTPRITRTMDSSQQIYFVHSGNALLHVWGDEQLGTRLRKAFQTP
jgi:hypothetical protein